jgi:hypothetical protein
VAGLDVGLDVGAAATNLATYSEKHRGGLARTGTTQDHQPSWMIVHLERFVELLA